MSNIKKCFKSRWGEDGYIVEADFSQLEVIALAFLSQDPQLYEDILKGVDTHAINAQKLFGPRFTPAHRKIAKMLSFQLQYGSGPGNMAKTNNIPLSKAKAFITNYYERYPKVKQWQELIEQTVVQSRVPTKEKTPLGLPSGQGFYDSITGRRYTFKEYDNSYKPGTTTFPTTQMKNYPVQGFATGDIVPMVLGNLYYVLRNDEELCNKALLINTVHDSVVLDVHKDVLHTTASTLKEVMEGAPERIKEVWGLYFDLPLRIEVTFGPNWLEQTEYKF